MIRQFRMLKNRQTPRLAREIGPFRFRRKFRRHIKRKKVRLMRMETEARRRENKTLRALFMDVIEQHEKEQVNLRLEDARYRQLRQLKLLESRYGKAQANQLLDAALRDARKRQEIEEAQERDLVTMERVLHSLDLVNQRELAEREGMSDAMHDELEAAAAEFQEDQGKREKEEAEIEAHYQEEANKVRAYFAEVRRATAEELVEQHGADLVRLREKYADIDGYLIKCLSGEVADYVEEEEEEEEEEEAEEGEVEEGEEGGGGAAAPANAAWEDGNASPAVDEEAAPKS